MGLKQGRWLRPPSFLFRLSQASLVQTAFVWV